MALSRINNQAVKLYTPTETLFNDKTSTCEWHIDYFPKVVCNDITEIVLATEVSGSDVSLDPDVGTERSGSATSLSADKLVDSGADFDGSSGGVIVTTQMIVRNTDTGNSANVLSVDSATELSLDDNIFTDLGSANYSISFYELTGDTSIGTNQIVKTSGAAGTFGQNGILTTGGLYRFSMDISSITTTGVDKNITISIGGVTVAEIDATTQTASTVTFYGYAESSQDVLVSVDDTVAASFTDIELFPVTDFIFKLRDCETDEVVYNSSTADLISSATTNQIKMSFDWGDLSTGYNCEGCYYIEIIEDGETDDYTFRSDCFQLLDSHDCTVKLTGTNYDNAFGIDFIGLAYSPFVRIHAELETPTYDGDKENEEDSLGISKTLYFKSEKKRNLFIWQQPEHIHDFLRLLIGYDDFQVDGVDYVSLDASYSPEAERIAGKLPDLSNSSIELRLTTDLNENRFC